jgi:hypothetical protein
MVTPDDYQAFADRCFMYSFERLKSLVQLKRKLAHYTSAENGLSILKGRQMWLRNAQVMNDHSEILHGRKCLDSALESSKLGRRFLTIMEAIQKGFGERMHTHLNMNRYLSQRYTYITSLSEFDEGDNLGKLSMWRAYGSREGGVALIFNDSVWEGENNQLAVYYSPVLYGDEGRFGDEFERVLAALEGHLNEIKKLDPSIVFSIIYRAFHFAVLSTKHAGFEEEREWRLIHSPLEEPSKWLEYAAESVRGVPQTVYKIPLKNKPGLGMPTLEIPNLINRVLIGPCLYPQQVADAYSKALTDAGVKDAMHLITISEIPLRQWS